MKAIIFDFDGVLADTYEFNKRLSTKVVGYDVSHEDFKAHHDGNVFETPIIPFTKKSSEEFYIEYFKDIHHIKPFLSLEQIRLLDNTYDLFIISSNSEAPIKKFLTHHELDYFKQVFGAESHKSKVEKFKILFKQYNLQPSDCIFVTDTLGDILEGNKVGIKTIAVDFGFHEKERLEKGNPYKIISSFDEIFDIIENIKK